MNIFSSVAVAAAVFVGMLVFGDLGRRLGQRQLERDPEAARAGSGVIDGAVFALLGLLVAFTFSGAADRFDARRGLITEETNAVGTAWLRLDLLPAADQPPLRDLFRRYLDSRIDVYRSVPDMQAVERALARGAALQAEIWSRAMAACQRPEGQRAIVVVLPALNEMFDIATTRTLVARIHQPLIIFGLLIGLGLICSLLGGYAMAGAWRSSWTHHVGFAAVLALTVYVILDLEYPRIGLIRVDALDRALVDLRASMD